MGNRRVEFRGQSGASYAFLPLEDDGRLRPIGVTYAIAEPAADGWRLLRVGHSNNLAARSWAAPLAELRQAHAAAQVWIRLNVNARIREAEAADLAANLGPA